VTKGIVNALQYVLTIAAIIGVWWAYVIWWNVPAYLLPPPNRVWQELVTLFSSGRIWPHLSHTSGVLVVGFVLGSLLGSVLGFLLGNARAVEEVLRPYIVFFQAAPKIALAPLFIIWFGLGLTSKLVLVVSLAFFPAMVGALLGVRSVRKNMLELSRLLRLHPLQRWWTIELPSSAPYLFAGLRVGTIQATVGAIVAEWMAGDRGLGFLMIFGSTTYRSPLLIAAVVLTVALGIVAHQAVVWLEAWATRWSEA
jgi:NitT/TauT family transport system permease protein